MTKRQDEPYLADYIKRFKDDKLQSTYSGKGFEEIKALSLEVSLKKPKPSQLMSTTIPTFSFTVPEGEYLLLGDDRLVRATAAT